MKRLLIASLLLLSILGNANAMTAFKSKSGDTLAVYTESEYQAIDNGSVPACLKNKGKILGANNAYKKAFGSNKDACSPSAASKRFALSRGVKEVIIIKVAELPESEYKKNVN